MPTRNAQACVTYVYMRRVQEVSASIVRVLMAGHSPLGGQQSNRPLRTVQLTTQSR